MERFWRNSWCGMLAVLMVGAAFWLQPVMAEAGISTLHPGAGNRPPKTPEWNVEQSRDSGNTGAEAGKNTSKGVRKLDKKNVPVTMLSVMLGEGLYSASVSGAGDFELVDGNAGKTLERGSAGSNLKITVDGSYIAINGKKTKSRIVTLQAKNGADGVVKYNGSSYRGTLRIISDGARLQVLNQLSLEDYVKGVLPSEMSSSWPEEALKAQAVAARTFALYNRNKGHKASGYDLCSSSHCQVYSGMAAETAATDKAVEATRGQVMYYNHQVIYAAFHSSSGGATENSEDVWGAYQPYLRSVTDDDSQSPYHSWTARFTVAQVEKQLASSGKGVGKLQSITLGPISTSGSTTGRTASGRAYGIKFTGSSGAVTITGEQARTIFGLKSAMFNIRTERSVQLPASGSKKAAKNAKKADGPLAAAPAAMNGSTMRIGGAETVIFDGHGFGHGLGMAQYGAKAMADKGRKYDEILHHYYTDVVIQEIY